MSEVKNSVLADVKKVLGILPEYEHFDQEILIHINSIISILVQLGVCSDGLTVKDDSTTWDDILGESPVRNQLEIVKTYVSLRVKILFDPPSSSFVLDSMTRQINELEWRINCIVDPI